MVHQHTGNSIDVDLSETYTSGLAASAQTLSSKISQQLFEHTGERISFTSDEMKAFGTYARRYTFCCSCDELNTLARFIVFSAVKETAAGKSAKEAILDFVTDESDQERAWRKYLQSATCHKELNVIDHAIWDHIQERVFSEIRAMSTRTKPCRVLEVGGSALTGFKRISKHLDSRSFDYTVVDLLDEDTFRQQHGDVPVQYLSKSIDHVSREELVKPIDLVISVRSFEYLPSPNTTLARLGEMGRETLQCILVNNSNLSPESFHLKNKIFYYESLGAQYYLLGELVKGTMETSEATEALHSLILTDEVSEKVLVKQLTHWNKMLKLLNAHSLNPESSPTFSARLKRRRIEVSRRRQQLQRMYDNRFSNELSKCKTDEELFRYYMTAGFNPTYNAELRIGSSARHIYHVHQLDKISANVPPDFYKNFEPYFSSTLFDSTKR